MRRACSLGALAALATTAAACHDLPDLGTCGNGIVEQANGEACDSGDPDLCTPTCQLRCTTTPGEAAYVPVGTDAQGADVFCPDARYRCGSDTICRAPSGLFEPPGSSLPFDVGGAPVLGDVDNDGLLDLVGTSATNIYVRFASTTGAPLGDLVVQDAPASDAPYVIFDPQPPRNDPMRSELRLVSPTEGLAVLRSDNERFAPDLALAVPVQLGRLGLVVRDPDPRLGDVVVAVEVRSSMPPGIGVDRVQVPSPVPGIDSVPAADLPDCGGGAGGEPWRTVDIEVAPDRRSFVIVTQRDAAPPDGQPWHVCRYTHDGLGGWSLAQLDLVPPAPTPSTTTLANLDGDACLELVVRAAAGFAMFDATGAGCGLVGPPVVLPVVGGGSRLLSAGQIIPGDRDELVLENGVFRACVAAEDCGAFPPGTFLRVAGPTRATGTWSAAALTDLNGDGALDVVAGRATGPDQLEPDVDVVRGGPSTNVYRANTAAPVDFLVAGDFDGDRLGDVAMVEATPLGERIVVLFGTQEAIVGTPRPMSGFRSGSDMRLDRFGEIGWSPSKRGVDGVDDLLVVDLRQTPSLQNPPLVGVMVGDAGRLMTSPRFPPTVATGAPIAAVAAGPFADIRGSIEVLAIGGSRAMIYNVLGNSWVTPVLDVPAATTVAPPIATLGDGPGRARAVARGAGAEIVVFAVRGGAFTSCKVTAAGEAVELRGIDIDDDDAEIDEVVMLYESGGARSLQMFRITGSPPACSLERVLDDVLEGCVDVASTGVGLIAICRIPGDVGPAANAARGVFPITNVGGRFVRAAEPIARVQGDGRFLTAGDYDGDGVLDLAIAVQRVDEIGVQLLRQCPAHDTRPPCGPPPP